MKLIMEHYDLLQMSVSSLMMLLKQCFASMQTLQMPLHVDMRLASKHNSFSAALLEAAAVMQQLSLLASGSSSMQLDSQCLPVERCFSVKHATAVHTALLACVLSFPYSAAFYCQAWTS
jgi:hypothetical protein